MLALCALALALPQSTWIVDASAVGPGFGTAAAPYQRVDFAVAAASTLGGDTILVRPGTYVDEAIDFGGKNLRVESTDGRATTLLMGRDVDSNPVSIATLDEGESVELVGFTLRDGLGTPLDAPGFVAGGAILVDSSSLRLEDCLIRNCQAERGGGVAVLGGGSFTGVQSRFQITRAWSPNDGMGGGIYAETGSTIDLDRVRFSGNNATTAGGCVYVEGTALTVTDGRFSAFVSGNGAGIAALQSTVTIHGARFHDCINLARGGGLYALGCQVAIDDCEFNNNVSLHGGGVHLANSSAMINDTVFNGNGSGTGPAFAPGSGGAVFTDTPVDLRRCLFTSNKMLRDPLDQGGATSGPVRAVQCTFGYNRSSFGPQAVYAGPIGTQPPVLDSCIVELRDSLFPGPMIDPAATVRYSVVDRPFPGTGNIVGLVDCWDGLSYHPLPNSTAHDAGNPALGLDPDGSFPDAGASTFDPSYCAEGCSGPQGVLNCAAVPNSTGLPATISAVGNNNPERDRLVIAVNQLPPGALGYFVGSRTNGFSPGAGGSAGDLCVGGSVLRFNDTVVQATPIGRNVAFRPLLQALPDGGTIEVGEWFIFQLWYRGAGTGGTTSNFSEALLIRY